MQLRLPSQRVPHRQRVPACLQLLLSCSSSVSPVLRRMLASLPASLRLQHSLRKQPLSVRELIVAFRKIFEDASASAGCSFEKAMIVGPMKCLSDIQAVPSTARRASVLRTTRSHTPFTRLLYAITPVMAPTSTPRESATTAERAPLAAS